MTYPAKTCASCRWCIIPGGFAKCRAPENEVKSMVGFGYEARWDYCSLHRSDGLLVSWWLGTCGERGRWWEPKEIAA